jgi:hypothetical protein
MAARAGSSTERRTPIDTGKSHFKGTGIGIRTSTERFPPGNQFGFSANEDNIGGVPGGKRRSPRRESRLRFGHHDVGSTAPSAATASECRNRLLQFGDRLQLSHHDVALPKRLIARIQQCLPGGGTVARQSLFRCPTPGTRTGCGALFQLRLHAAGSGQPRHLHAASTACIQFDVV